MSGTYTATLYTPQGLVKEQLFVTVQTSQPSGSRTPPSIYSPNQRQIDLNIGEPFTLECVARGDPMPSIRIQPPEVRRQQTDVQFAVRKFFRILLNDIFHLYYNYFICYHRTFNNHDHNNSHSLASKSPISRKTTPAHIPA